VPREDGARLDGEYSQAPYEPSGAAAMLRALVEGVCGVRDDGVLFDRIHLAPRWPATGQAAARSRFRMRRIRLTFLIDGRSTAGA
jgi:hypothetical protein